MASLIAVAFLSGCTTVSRGLTKDLATEAVSVEDPEYVDTRVLIADARMGPGEDGEIDLERVTNAVQIVIRDSGSFSEVLRGECGTDFVIVPTVVKLTDIFDNVVHLRVQGISCRSRGVVFDRLYLGSAFTQTGSLKVIATLLSEHAGDLRAAIFEDIQSNASVR